MKKLIESYTTGFMAKSNSFRGAVLAMVLAAVASAMACGAEPYGKKIKVLNDVVALFPETVPDTMVAMNVHTGELSPFHRSKPGSDYFIGGRDISLSDNFILMKQRGCDSLYRSHEMSVMSDGNARFWMPDTLLYAPSAPFASYPYGDTASRGMVANSSRLYFSNPWTFVKIEWKKQIKAPTFLTVTADNGIAGWLEFRDRAVCPCDSSVSSISVRVRPGDNSLWLALPGGMVQDIAVSLEGKKYSFRDVELKAGKNIVLTLKSKSDEPEPGYLKVDVCQDGKPYSVRIESNHRLGWQKYRNHIPPRFNKNTVAFQYQKVDKRLEYFCFALKPNISYDLKVTLKRGMKLIDTLEFNNISVLPGKGETIYVCPGLGDAKPLGDIEFKYPCSCLEPTDKMSLADLSERVPGVCAVNAELQGHTDCRIRQENVPEEGRMQFVGRTSLGLGKKMDMVMLVEALKIVRQYPWEKELNKNNPDLNNNRPKNKKSVRNEEKKDFRMPSPAHDVTDSYLETARLHLSDYVLVIDGCNDLVNLCIGNCDIAAVEIRNCPNLVSVSLPFNTLVDLDIRCCPELKVVHAPGNYIENLTIECCPEIEAIHVPYNRLTDIDLSEFSDLTELDCSNNRLDELDVSKNISLKYLACPYNYLKYLNLEDNFEMESLSCTANDNIRVVLPESVTLTKYNITGKLYDRSKLRPLKFYREYLAGE